MSNSTNQNLEIHEDFIYGIKGLAKFLRISRTSAKKLMPRLTAYELGPRMIRFRKSEVLAAMSSNNQNA